VRIQQHNEREAPPLASESIVGQPIRMFRTFMCKTASKTDCTVKKVFSKPPPGPLLLDYAGSRELPDTHSPHQLLDLPRLNKTDSTPHPTKTA